MIKNPVIERCLDFFNDSEDLEINPYTDCDYDHSELSIDELDELLGQYIDEK